MIEIKRRREVFFDDYLIDTERTTADIRIHRPVRKKENIITFDKPWEDGGVSYVHFVKADDKYIMYYECRGKNDRGYHFCYAESFDGFSWVRPSLGLCDYGGSTDNNIIIWPGMIPELTAFDNMKVFIDENPACSPEERFKSVMMWCGHGTLIYLVSSDGIHWRWGDVITTQGEFDSLNLAFWDKERGKYFCYYRGEHEPAADPPQEAKSFVPKVARMLYDPERGAYKAPAAEGEEGVYFMRDIRVIESVDFKHWSDPVLLNFGAHAPDIQLYTNNVMPYPRAEQVLVGFPTRYVERKSWTKNYDELCGRELRLTKMKKLELREGLALTDCAFMVSRDGYNFTRYDEAFMIPPPEHPLGWVYGDCYPAPFFMETESDIVGAESEYSIFMEENHTTFVPAAVYRHTIRKDGFVSRHAGGSERLLVTKPFVYEGENLYANIESSARGYLYFTLIAADGTRYESSEIFGNSTDKRIHFDDEVVKSISGSEVTLEIRMLDADIYAIRFGQ